MAQQALTVQVASGGRFMLGIGLSHKPVVEGMYGESFDKPVRHMREYLSVLVPLLREGKVSFHGEVFNCELTCDIEPRLTPPVYVAALGEQMLKLAGTMADGTVTWMTGPATHRQPHRAGHQRGRRESRTAGARDLGVAARLSHERSRRGA